jgi:serine protease Do
MDWPLRYSLFLLICFSMAAGSPFASASGFAAGEDWAPTLLHVNIIVETRDARNTIEINGKRLSNYSPVIIQDFPSVGIALDKPNYVMTFLGYRWLDIYNKDAKIFITSGEGKKWGGRLVGIDQTNGVAVIELLEGKLDKTPVCVQCEIKDGLAVMAPVVGDPDRSKYREAQVLSVGNGSSALNPRAWILTTNRPFPDIGMPILTTDHRILGFIAGLDPMDMRTVVYPVSQLLSSAERILKTGGDIRTGWMGVMLDASGRLEGPGVAVLRVEPNSPAQKAGLIPGDVLVQFGGHEIKSAPQFIQLVQNSPIGSSVKLDIIRQGHRVPNAVVSIEARKVVQTQGRFSFNLTGAFDASAKGIIPELKPQNPRLLMGLSTEMLTPPLADALHLPGQTGLLVIDVAQKMPADQAGVMPGDVITSIDGQPIIDAPGFATFLLTHPWGAQSVMKMIRKGSERTVVVHLPQMDQGQ